MILRGDCIEVMATMPDESVDAIVTDPPYGLGFMGKAWDALPPGQEWAEQCLRVLKPGGHLVAFGGTRTYHRLAVAIEDAGFEIRDQLQWMYGSGFPKSHNLPGGYGTALKPAHEPIVLARKPLTGTVAQTVQEYGTGALNIDGCRVTMSDADADFIRKTARPNTAGQHHEGAVMNRPPNPTVNVHAAGRWPANLILDPEAGAMLDAQSGESATRRNENPSEAPGGNTWGGTFQTNRGARGHTDSGGASRFFYTAKASRAERNAGLDGLPERESRGNYGDGIQDNRPHTPEGYEYRATTRNHHPTVKPIDLMRWLVRLVTPPGGRVLDPFAGSGTTGIAAHLEGFQFTGIEREDEYADIAEARIKWWQQHEGDTAEILARAGLAERAAKEHEEAGQLALLEGAA